MKKSIIFVIIGIVVLLAALGAGYYYFNGKSTPGNVNNYPGGRFNSTRRFAMTPINQSQINDVTSFFASNPSSDQISSYCGGNRLLCFYYCRNISTTNDACTQIMNFTRGNFNRTYGPRQ